MKIELATMEGGTINSISFYTTSDNIPTKTPGTVVVYVKEVGYTEINAFETKEGSSVIYQGKLNIISITDGGLLTIPFNTPYTFNGGNLLIGIENTTDIKSEDIYFYGQNVRGASVAGVDKVSEEYMTASPKARAEFAEKTGNATRNAEAPRAQEPSSSALIYRIDGTPADESSHGILIQNSQKFMKK